MNNSPANLTLANSTSPVALQPLPYLARLEQTGDLIGDCRRFLQAVMAELYAVFHPTQPLTPLLAARAKAVDEVLLALWQQYLGDTQQALLAAVGGYGRGELYPHSDIDILFLCHDDIDETTDGLIGDMSRSLWDLGLSIGQSVRKVGECTELARSDLTIFTSMLELRPLTGNHSLVGELESAMSIEHMWDSKAFYKAKLEETRQRHAKYANTEYNLEPNVKNGPGGLRDMQVIGWIARRHYGVALDRLEAERFLTEDEQRMLEAGRNFIGQVRFALHQVADREEDRLLFDHQRSLAAMWEMVDGDKLAVEQFMQVYYRWAQSLNQLSELLLQIFDQQILHGNQQQIKYPIDEDFEVIAGLLAARHERAFTDNPSNLLRVFVTLANDNTIKGIAPETWRLLRAANHFIDPTFRADPVNQRLFMALLQSPYGVTLQLRRMARHGILGRYLPEFGRIIGQMQFDLFHAYTVDAHTLEVLANTRRFMRADYTDKFPVSTRIAQRLRKPSLLYIAALYHDIGKGRGGDHSELGAVDAHGFCERHKLDARDTELVVWLVKNHLLMSSVSQRKDISDPEEILRFASHVATEERLDYLYTLTVADIHGTNPELWNAWRSSLLRQLYTETRRALRRGLENPLARRDVVEATRRASADLLEYRGFFEEDLCAIWAARGDDYFLRERPEDIAWHTEAIANHAHVDRPLVLVRQSVDSPVANATQIFVHGPDTEDLFARICAELEILDLSVNDARIYLGDDGYTLDTFFVLQADGNPVPGDEVTLSGIQRVLQQALEHGKLRKISRRTPRQLRSFPLPTETTIHQDIDRGWTVLEVSTPDRPGLLARLGDIFIQLDVAIQGAKIQTLGERVEDVFFITNDTGGAILDEDRLQALQHAICSALDEGVRATA